MGAPLVRLLLQLEKGFVRLWDTQTGSLIKEKELFSLPYYDLSLSPDGNNLALVNYNGKVVIYQYPTGALIDSGLKTNATSIQYLTDNQLLLNIDEKLSLVSLDNIDQPQVLAINQPPALSTISSGGRLITYMWENGVTIAELDGGKF